MNQTTVSDIQVHLSRYLSNAITLRQFRDWFDAETWGLAADQDSLTRRLAGEIELRIAEFTSDHLSESELRELLSAIVPDEVRFIESMDFQIPVTVAEPAEMTF
jgi:hypothetical protein